MLIISRSKLYYTASGIVTPVGGRRRTGRPPTSVIRSKHVEVYNKLIIKEEYVH